MDEKLKPCPFCGGAATADGKTSHMIKNVETRELETVAEYFYAYCLICGVSTIGHLGMGQISREQAIKFWNERRP